MRFRYRDGAGSGHGRQRWAKGIKPLERAVRDMCGRWQKQFISDMLKVALKEGCGMVLYREPTKPLREKEFFARSDTPFDWTAFIGRLKFKCESKGLRFESERIGLAEWRGESEKQETAT